MATIIFFVALAVLTFSTFATLAFWEVAFVRAERPPAHLAPQDLPLLSGDALRQWGFVRARQMVASFAYAPEKNAAALGREVASFTKRVIRAITGSGSDSSRCDRRTYRSIPVTAPESVAIVETLRRHLSKRQLRRVKDVAAQNIKRLQFPLAMADASQPIICPLLDKNGVCASHETRPLFCLTHGSCGSSCECRTNATVQAEPSFSTLLGEGVAQGLVAGLKDAGTNSRLCELNSALAEALATDQ